MRTILLPVLMLVSVPSWGQSSTSSSTLFVDPHVAVGASNVGGTTFLLGLDAGYRLTNEIAAGVGAFGAFGERASRDRVLGVGPFVQFVYGITPFLTFSAREDVDYVDQRRPISDDRSYLTDTGLASFTTVGLHLTVANVFGVSVGYRAALGLSNDGLGNGRSMPFVGFSIGF